MSRFSCLLSLVIVRRTWVWALRPLRQKKCQGYAHVYAGSTLLSRQIIPGTPWMMQVTVPPVESPSPANLTIRSCRQGKHRTRTQKQPRNNDQTAFLRRFCISVTCCTYTCIFWAISLSGQRTIVSSTCHKGRNHIEQPPSNVRLRAPICTPVSQTPVPLRGLAR